VLFDFLHQVNCLLLQLLHSIADLLGSIVHESVVYFERVVSSTKTHNPILIIYDIIIIRKIVFVERKLQSFSSEGLI
jgi:hypothetical protein